jgi:hypothetical protein
MFYENSKNTMPLNLDPILYPNLLHQNWQMSHSERLAISQLLTQVKPDVAIEVGTYQGGSLSLVSSLANQVYSLDIDAGVAEVYAKFGNVEFVIGDSGTTLPDLLSKLSAENADVGFVLIDGDHSAEAVMRDINAVLAQRPTGRTFVVCHDSFNPECRRGMLAAKWTECPWLAFADLDFVSGVVIQQGGPFDGQMWGGLALFVLDATTESPAPLQATASQLYDRSVALSEKES